MKFFKDHNCGRGAACLYSHDAQILRDERTRNGECRTFAKTGECKFGDACKFIHDKKGMAAVKLIYKATQEKNQELRSKNGICKRFINGGKGECKFGDQCTYVHVSQTQLEKYKPVSSKMAKKPNAQ